MSKSAAPTSNENAGGSPPAPVPLNSPTPGDALREPRLSLVRMMVSRIVANWQPGADPRRVSMGHKVLVPTDYAHGHLLPMGDAVVLADDVPPDTQEGI